MTPFGHGSAEHLGKCVGGRGSAKSEHWLPVLKIQGRWKS